MILLTGGSGFLGKRVEKMLAGEKEEVVNLTRQNMYKNLTRMKVVKADLVNLKEIINKLQSFNKIETIIHLAAITDNNAQKEKDYDLNTLMANNIVKIGKLKKTKRIIFISSNAVNYSDRKYALTKMKAEEVIIQSGINYTVIRPTLIVGKESKDIRKMVNIFRRLPLIPLPAADLGKSNPIFVEDVVLFIRKCMNLPKVCQNKIYSIGGLEKQSSRELVTLILESYGLKKKIVSLPLWLISIINPSMAKMISDDISVGIEKYRSEMNWMPKKITPDLINS